MTDETAHYKRDLDLWIKIIAICTPIVVIIMWGIDKAGSNARFKANAEFMERRVGKIEEWISVQEKYNMGKLQTDARNTEQLSQIGNRMQRIEVLLDSRLKKP